MSSSACPGTGTKTQPGIVRRQLTSNITQPKGKMDMDQVTLLDHFAGLAMQTLLRIGTTPIREQTARDGKPFDWPDAPYYFGYWDPLKDGRCEGVDSLAGDAYEVGTAMLRERTRRLAESGAAP